MGGCQSALDLYEACIVSSLLSNAGTWVEISDESVKLLDKLQDTFEKVLFALPASAQGASLRAALGLVGMKWRVWEAKIALLQAIRSREEGWLAKEVMEEQTEMGWPGLSSEVTAICKEVGLPDAATEEVSKDHYKKAIQYHHVKALKLELKGEKIRGMAHNISTQREYTGWGLL